MPGKVKLFNPRSCVRVNKENLGVKLYDWGMTVDTKAKICGFVTEWDIYKHPETKAGKFMPNY